MRMTIARALQSSSRATRYEIMGRVISKDATHWRQCYHAKADPQQIAQLLYQQNQMLVIDQRRKGEVPSDRKSPQDAYQHFMTWRMRNLLVAQTKGHTLRYTYLPLAYLPCNTPIAQLEPITIKQLRLETHHWGKYLLLRAIAPPMHATGVVLLCQDVKGDVVLVQMYHQEEERIREITESADSGILLLVKEPYFKITASQEYALRIDHLSDVIRVDETNTMVPQYWKSRSAESRNSFESFEANGDVLSGQEQWWSAIRKYSSAIDLSSASDQLESIRRKRAIAYLETKQYEAALADLYWPDSDSRPGEVELNCAVKALYRLQRFAEAATVLKILQKKFPQSSNSSLNLERAQQRCAEERTGRYDFKALQRKAKHIQPLCLDHATYVGPIKNQQTAGKGRGLFTTRPVEAGDLLLCEKAFAYASAPGSGDEDNKSQTLSMNVGSARGYMGGHVHLLKSIAEKLYLNPSVAPALTSLYHGNYRPAPTASVDGKPVVDTFLVEQIMSLNAFGCPVSSHDIYRRAEKGQPVDEQDHLSCGIWSHASLINHSCTGSAYRSFIGDMMIVRAARDLGPDEEVTIGYKRPHFEGNMREELKQWGFECGCAMCVDEKRTTTNVKTQRERLHTALHKESSSPDPDVAAIELLINKLDATYTFPASSLPRLGIWEFHMVIAYLQMDKENREPAFKAACKSLSSLGFVLDASVNSFEIKRWGMVTSELVRVFLFIAKALLESNEQDAARRAADYAKTVYKIVVGEDETFKATHWGRNENSVDMGNDW